MTACTRTQRWWRATHTFRPTPMRRERRPKRVCVNCASTMCTSPKRITKCVKSRKNSSSNSAASATIKPRAQTRPRARTTANTFRESRGVFSYTKTEPYTLFSFRHLEPLQPLQPFPTPQHGNDMCLRLGSRNLFLLRAIFLSRVHPLRRVQQGLSTE